jgi:hypothetical protein
MCGSVLFAAWSPFPPCAEPYLGRFPDASVGYGCPRGGEHMYIGLGTLLLIIILLIILL